MARLRAEVGRLEEDRRALQGANAELMVEISELREALGAMARALPTPGPAQATTSGAVAPTPVGPDTPGLQEAMDDLREHYEELLRRERAARERAEREGAGWSPESGDGDVSEPPTPSAPGAQASASRGRSRRGGESLRGLQDRLAQLEAEGQRLRCVPLCPGQFCRNWELFATTCRSRRGPPL